MSKDNQLITIGYFFVNLFTVVIYHYSAVGSFILHKIIPKGKEISRCLQAIVHKGNSVTKGVSVFTHCKTDSLTAFMVAGKALS